MGLVRRQLLKSAGSLLAGCMMADLVFENRDNRIPDSFADQSTYTDTHGFSRMAREISWLPLLRKTVGLWHDTSGRKGSAVYLG